VIEALERVTVIGRSGKIAGVHRSLCSLTQQLSGPLTDAKRCVTIQLVTREEADGAVDDGAVGEGLGAEPPPHAVTINAMASVEIRALMTNDKSRRRSRARQTLRTVSLTAGDETAQLNRTHEASVSF
jgi:hypothetical protein